MTLIVQGKISWFGGPLDTGMGEDEPLAWIMEVSQKPEIFLSGATEALGRNLDPEKYFIATRWDYDQFPREHLLTHTGLIIAPSTGIVIAGVVPADWGPGEQTGRELDVSSGLLDALGLETDCEAIFIYPFERRDILTS